MNYVSALDAGVDVPELETRASRIGFRAAAVPGGEWATGGMVVRWGAALDVTMSAPVERDVGLWMAHLHSVREHKRSFLLILLGEETPGISYPRSAALQDTPQGRLRSLRSRTRTRLAAWPHRPDTIEEREEREETTRALFEKQAESLFRDDR